jgi:threonine/homoserine/homoserine lactone efflux protein
MNFELIFILSITILPIVISPGPANILYAASGSTFGIKKTIPFWLATNITSVFQTLAVGFGLDSIIQIYPNIIIYIKYMGIVFLLYLSYKFFNMSINSQKEFSPLTFKDGVVIEFFNAKYLLIPAIMFSQFYNPSEGYIQIILLALLLVSLTLTTSMIWIIGGSSLTRFLKSAKMQKRQSFIFGTLLLVTAIWLSF